MKRTLLTTYKQIHSTFAGTLCIRARNFKVIRRKGLGNNKAIFALLFFLLRRTPWTELSQFMQLF